MHKIVIADASCLIILDKIGELNLLENVYDTVSTTPEVAQEFQDELPDWIMVLGSGYWVLALPAVAFIDIRRFWVGGSEGWVQGSWFQVRSSKFDIRYSIFKILYSRFQCFNASVLRLFFGNLVIDP